ncbi:DUF4097 family beta strand repeat-containing protein [Bacillus sp. SL00103]
MFFTSFEKGELLVKIPTDYHKNVKITVEAGSVRSIWRREAFLEDVILKSTSGTLMLENLQTT